MCELTVEQQNQVNNVRFGCFEDGAVKRKRPFEQEEAAVKRQKAKDSLFSLGELMQMREKATENMREIANLVRKSRELDHVLDFCEEKVTQAVQILDYLRQKQCKSLTHPLV